MKIQTIETKMSKAAVEKLVADETVSKSSKMKQLFAAGYSVKEIASLMNVRYNFVYNVVSNEVRMKDITVEKTEKSDKKKNIIDLHIAGKNNTEISKELKTNYQYVYKVVKEYKDSQVTNKEEGAV